MKLLAELKRRNVIRMAGMYLVGAWLLIQIAETPLPIFHTPDWMLQALVVLLALGLLPALVFSWIHESSLRSATMQIDPNRRLLPDSNKHRVSGQRKLRIMWVILVCVAYHCKRNARCPATPQAERTMLLRRVIEHVRDQNWTAVGIDFVIVVVGVFVGIQVSNWNEARAEKARERLLLGELRAEIAEAIRVADLRRQGFEQVARSGQRAIDFLDSGQDCGDACWPVIVDFFHASQWQSMPFGLRSYQEMRRSGWPSNRAITEATDAYEFNTRALAVSTDESPAYRTLVRGLIPLAIHRPYWTSCYKTDVAEIYVEDCPPGVPPAVSAMGMQAIRAHPDIHRTLTEWIGFTTLITGSLARQNDAARRALAMVDEELDNRR